MRLSILIVMFVFGFVPSAFANDQVGTLTQVQGEVKLFFSPGNEMKGPSPHALFEGTYYSVKDAVAGSSVQKGNI